MFKIFGYMPVEGYCFEEGRFHNYLRVVGYFLNGELLYWEVVELFGEFNDELVLVEWPRHLCANASGIGTTINPAPLGGALKEWSLSNVYWAMKNGHVDQGVELYNALIAEGFKPSAKVRRRMAAFLKKRPV